ncbi:MAG: efflux transporter outer membrane subunit [Pseudomonadota bacterium]
MKRILALSLAAVTSACAMGPDYQRPELATPSSVTTLPDAPELAGTELRSDWWNQFKDPVLTGLVDKAITNNPDIEAALARIDQSRAFRGSVKSAGLPSLSARSGANRLRQSENAFDLGQLSQGGGGSQGPGNALPIAFGEAQKLFDAAGQASWEIDLFGRVRRRVEAASARVQVAEEDYRGILVAIISDTVQSYADLRAAQAQLDIARENLATAQKTEELTNMLLSEGLVPEFDVSRARAERRALEAAIPPLQALIRSRNAAIAALTGQTPDQTIEQMLVQGELNPIAASIPAGLSSDLLRRRPDVRLAERRLAAETADIGAEIADLYPSFSLSGLFGFTSLSLDTLFDSGSQQWSVGGALNWPIFNGGRNRAEVREAKAGAAEARALYRAAVLGAFRDVDEALSVYVYTLREREFLKSVVEDRERVFALSEMRYREGLDSLIVLLRAQTALNAAKTNLAIADGQVLQTTVAAYRSLGGGWDYGEAQRTASVASEFPSQQ